MKSNFKWEKNEDYTNELPLLGKPLKIRNDFSAFAVRPFDANHDGVSGIGISKINAAIQIEQLMPLTNRQFVYISSNKIIIKSITNFNKNSLLNTGFK